MDHQTIARLSSFLPPAEEDRLADNFGMARRVADDDDVGRFIRSYTDLSFGWNFARTLHANNMEFPCWLKGKDAWVWRAWMGLKDPANRDPDLVAAMALARDGLNGRRDIVRAILVSQDLDKEHLNRLCQHAPLTPRAMEAFEVLFFNVLDRRRDAMFISSVVYPRTRLVEVYEHYLRNEGMGEFLMRAGYNNGLHDVGYWAGFSPDLVNELVMAPDLAQRLEKHIMAHGMILARNGFMNQRADAHALGAARGLIAAAKQGGVSTEEDPVFGRMGIGDAIAGDAEVFLRGQAVEAQQRAVELVEV